MGGTTDTQSIRFGYVTDVLDFNMMKNEADDIAVQLDAADVARTTALKRPVAWARRAAVLAIPVASTTSVQFDTEVFDTHGMINIAGLPFRIVVGATAGPGVYLVQADVQGDMTGWTRADVEVQLNAGTLFTRSYAAPQTGSPLTMSMLVNLALITDYLTMSVRHEGGGTTNMTLIDLRAVKISN